MLLFELSHPTLRLAVLTAERVQTSASSAALLAEVLAAERKLQSDPSSFPENVRAAVRDVLRVGGYKPTGRGKPASELLLALATREGLPRISNLVEINNLTSLESGLPISIFDARRIGDELAIRFGRAEESYVFNASGHSMSLEGLPIVCRGPAREPVGNAVRDSMSCKVDASTDRIVAVLYGSSRLPDEVLLRAAQRMASLLVAHASAEGVQIALLP
ncbi:MAG: hypothetical protein JWN48_2729 [Myxococcaceae bacterium]|nr:hypothetical protein [Myxococcaceae bacterium]